MALPEKAIKEFKEVWKKEHGVELSDAEARESSENLLGFFKLLMDIDRRK